MCRCVVLVHEYVQCEIHVNKWNIWSTFSPSLLFFPILSGGNRLPPLLCPQLYKSHIHKFEWRQRRIGARGRNFRAGNGLEDYRVVEKHSWQVSGMVGGNIAPNLGWAAEYFESDWRNLAVMFLHSSVCELHEGMGLVFNGSDERRCSECPNSPSGPLIIRRNERRATGLWYKCKSEEISIVALSFIPLVFAATPQLSSSLYLYFWIRIFFGKSLLPKLLHIRLFQSFERS